MAVDLRRCDMSQKRYLTIALTKGRLAHDTLELNYVVNGEVMVAIVHFLEDTNRITLLLGKVNPRDILFSQIQPDSRADVFITVIHVI